MNMLLVLIALVAFTYFGDKRVPKILKDNKQIILGVLVGVLLHHVLKDRVEGFCALKLPAKRILDKRNDNDQDPICGEPRRAELFLPGPKNGTGYCTRQMQEKCNNYGGVLATPPNPIIPLRASPPNETEDEKAIRIEKNKENNCKAVFADPTGINNDMQHVCDYTPGVARPPPPPCPPDPDKPDSGVSAWSEDENDCTCLVQKEAYKNKTTGVRSWRCDISGGDQ